MLYRFCYLPLILKKMNIPKLIKAGDLSLGSGKSITPSKVDCRVIAEDLYQEIIDIIAEIRTNDIDNYMNGKDNLIPLKTRKKIQDFLSSNGK